MDENEGRKVLVISDFPDWEDLIQDMLERGGRPEDEVKYAPGGYEGMTMIDLDPPDLIIYYLWTLDMDGFDFCWRFKSTQSLQNTPIILMGAASPTTVHPKARRVGAAGYLRQFFEAQDLIKACDTVLRGGVYYPTSFQRPKFWEKSGNDQERKVLIINDNPEMADLMQIILGRGRNDEVKFAWGGNKGLAAAQRDPPDLIILAVMMPDLSGWDICRQIRSLPDLWSVPVLFYAGLVPNRAYPYVQQVGGQGYLILPFGPRELLNARDLLLKGQTYFPRYPPQVR